MTVSHDIHCHHHFEWGVIAAATAVSLAFTIVLTQFGSIIGLSSDRVMEGIADVSHWAVISIGLWIMAVQMSSSALGGYMAGRIRSSTPDLTQHENEVRDGFYGLSVWAVSTAVIFIAVSIGGAFLVSVEVADEAVDLTPDLLDKEQGAAIIFAFILGATSLVSAVISWAASTVGGDHRDSKVDLSHYYKFRGR